LISTIVVRPAKAAPSAALLSFTIYANDDWAWNDAKTMAAHGYAGVVAYTRAARAAAPMPSSRSSTMAPMPRR
jgi:cephalosporin-C deacetylase-like acetyl esterase